MEIKNPTEVEVDRFKAQADDGTVHTIVKLMMLIPNTAISGDNSPIKGSTRLVLLNRKADVRRRDDSTFEIVDTKQILWKIG